MWKLVSLLGLFDIIKSAGKWLLKFGLGQLVMKAGIFMAFNIINALIVSVITQKNGFSADGVFLNPLTIGASLVNAFTSIDNPYVRWGLTQLELPVMVVWCSQAMMASFLCNMWIQNMRAAAGAAK